MGSFSFGDGGQGRGVGCRYWASGLGIIALKADGIGFKVWGEGSRLKVRLDISRSGFKARGFMFRFSRAAAEFL